MCGESGKREHAAAVHPLAQPLRPPPSLLPRPSIQVLNRPKPPNSTSLLSSPACQQCRGSCWEVGAHVRQRSGAGRLGRTTHSTFVLAVFLAKKNAMTMTSSSVSPLPLQLSPPVWWVACRSVQMSTSKELTNRACAKLQNAAAVVRMRAGKSLGPVAAAIVLRRMRQFHK